jgi:hypothetical protein
MPEPKESASAFVGLPASAGLPGVSSGSDAWVDLDNDGRLDILISGFDATNHPVLSLFKNNTPLANTNTVRLANLARLTNDFFRLHFKAPTGFSYRVQASTNLANWIILGPPAQATPGLQQFTDGNLTNYPERFYRVSTP